MAARKPLSVLFSVLGVINALQFSAGAESVDELVVQDGHAALIRQVVANSEGVAATRSDDNTIRIWNILSRMLVRTITQSNVDMITLGSNRPRLAIARRPELDGPPIVEIVDVQSGRVERRLIETNFFESNSMPGGSVKCIVLSKDESLCAIAIEPGATLDAEMVDAVFVFECTNGRQVGKIQAKRPHGGFGGIEAIDFGADGKTVYFVAFGSLQKGAIGDKEASVVRTLDKNFAHCEALLISPKGEALAMLESESVRERYFDPSTDSQAAKPGSRRISVSSIGTSARNHLLTAKADIYSICFDDSGSRLFAGTSKGVAAWDTTTGSRVPGFKSVNDHHVSIAAVNGGILAARLNGNLDLLDARTGTSMRLFQHSDSFLNKLVISPNGHRIWASRAGDLYEWNLSGDQSAPAWGGDKTRDWLRFRDVVESGKVFDVANSASGEPVLLMENKTGDIWHTTNILVVHQQAGDVAVGTNTGILSSTTGYLSSDATIAFVGDNAGSTKAWRALDSKTGTTIGKFFLGDFWAEDHSTGKPHTAVGFKESFMGSHFSACNIETGDELWTTPLNWQFWMPDPAGRYILFAEETAQDVVIVDLQSTKAPRRLSVPEFRGLIPISLNCKFVFQTNSPTLEFWGGDQHIAFDLEKMERRPNPMPQTGSVAPVLSSSIFIPYHFDVVAGAAGIRAKLISDGSLEVAKVAGDKPLARLVFGGKVGEHEDYLVAQPDGFYACSPGGARLACVASGISAVSFDQFDLTHNRPDLVLSNIGVAAAADIHFYKDVCDRRLARASAAPSQKAATDVKRPAVDIKPQSCPTATESRSLPLSIQITSARQAVKSIMVTINDRLLSTNTSFEEITVAAGSRSETTLDLPLSAGENFVDLWVVDTAGIESTHRRVVVNCTSPPSQRTLFLIAAGVSTYANTNFNLRFAAKDAEDVFAFWNRRGRFAGFGRPASWTKKDEQFGFDNIQSLVLTNQQVTRESLQKAGGLIGHAGVDDLVIITFSGHGLRDSKGDYYFATHDTDFAKPQLRGFSEKHLEHLLAQSGARENLLLLDTCNSGEAEPGLAETRSQIGGATISSRRSADPNIRGIELEPPGAESFFVPLDEVFRDLHVGAGGGILAASGAMDFALEDDHWNNGVFTYAFLEGLESGKADLDRDTNVTFSELCRIHPTLCLAFIQRAPASNDSQISTEPRFTGCRISYRLHGERN